MREKGNSFTMKSEEFIGRGGNAFVADCGNGCVKKILNIKKCNREKIQRFKDEVTVMKRLNGTKGVLPILQDHLDDGKHEYWYTMPKAELLIEHINKSDNKYQECQKAIQQLILTLSCLHEKKISHRDIKPSNLYYYDGLYCFGDFGLVDFPDKFNELTKSYKQLGAWTTIAPEMKRNPKNADGIKADVYSFAKTIWIVLTGNDKCFDGTYDKLRDGGLMECHSAGKPSHLTVHWHVAKRQYGAYFFFDHDELHAVFSRCYGAHPDTKVDILIQMDPETNHYELALYRYGMKEPLKINESAYQLMVFRNKFECFRSENYNLPPRSWRW